MPTAVRRSVCRLPHATAATGIRPGNRPHLRSTSCPIESDTENAALIEEAKMQGVETRAGVICVRVQVACGSRLTGQVSKFSGNQQTSIHPP